MLLLLPTGSHSAKHLRTEAHLRAGISIEIRQSIVVRVIVPELTCREAIHLGKSLEVLIANVTTRITNASSAFGSRPLMHETSN